MGPVCFVYQYTMVMWWWSGWVGERRLLRQRESKAAAELLHLWHICGTSAAHLRHNICGAWWARNVCPPPRLGDERREHDLVRVEIIDVSLHAVVPSCKT